MYYEPAQLYHIYNRGNNRQTIFFDEKNYHYFLAKIERYILPYADVLAWCLMPNHFHLLVHVRPNRSRNPYQLNKGIQILLRSYTRGINLQQERIGSLFSQKTKGKHLSSIEYAQTCFHYIHQNPLRSGLEGRIGEWPYSSLAEYLGKEGERKICNLNMGRALFNLPEDMKGLLQMANQMLADPDIQWFY